MLLVEDGAYWFELRGLSVRGEAGPATGTGDGGLAWYAIASRRVLAWDYATLRTE